jgi:hypothetical protein
MTTSAPFPFSLPHDAFQYTNRYPPRKSALLVAVSSFRCCVRTRQRKLASAVMDTAIYFSLKIMKQSRLALHF